jgi:hypothetical protein
MLASCFMLFVVGIGAAAAEQNEPDTSPAEVVQPTTPPTAGAESPAAREDSTVTQAGYIIQAFVSVDNIDVVPAAFATVEDRSGHLVSNLKLFVNNKPMTVTYLDDAKKEPVYTLKLPNITGGTAIRFKAMTPEGRTIYAPPSAIFPTPIVLLEPQEGQAIKAAEPVLVLWKGGHGAGVKQAGGFQSMDGEVSYFKQARPRSHWLVIPRNRTIPGPMIVGVSAMAGDTQLLELPEAVIKRKSFFFVSRETGISLDVSDPDGLAFLLKNRAAKEIGRCSSKVASRLLDSIIPPAAASLSAVPAGCPDSGYHDYNRASAHCMAEAILSFGIANMIWDNRRYFDWARGSQSCRANLPAIYLSYCTRWRIDYAPMYWVGCCMCDNPPCPG